MSENNIKERRAGLKKRAAELRQRVRRLDNTTIPEHLIPAAFNLDYHVPLLPPDAKSQDEIDGLADIYWYGNYTFAHMDELDYRDIYLAGELNIPRGELSSTEDGSLVGEHFKGIGDIKRKGVLRKAVLDYLMWVDESQVHDDRAILRMFFKNETLEEDKLNGHIEDIKHHISHGPRPPSLDELFKLVEYWCRQHLESIFNTLDLFICASVIRHEIPSVIEIASTEETSIEDLSVKKPFNSFEHITQVVVTEYERRLEIFKNASLKKIVLSDIPDNNYIREIVILRNF